MNLYKLVKLDHQSTNQFVRLIHACLEINWTSFDETKSLKI